MACSSSTFLCKCEEQMGWISDSGEITSNCPSCGRRYIGRYNKKKLGIEAIEVDIYGKELEKENMFKKIKKHITKIYNKIF